MASLLVSRLVAATLGVAFALLPLAVTRQASARDSAPNRLEVLATDGSSWDDVLREIESSPATMGRVYALTVRSRGQAVPCGEYDLALDAVASRAFVLEGCDLATSATRLRVVDRGVLFAPGDVVPRPLPASLQAVIRQSATAWGGGSSPPVGSKIWCTVALQPYILDGLHGVRVPLPPERFELVPLDERVFASADGSGWIVRSESRMSVVFRYRVRDRTSGALVLEDVARLTCTDQPAAQEEVAMPTEIPAWASPSTPLPGPSSEVAAVWRAHTKPPETDPRGHTLSVDTQLLLGGATFNTPDAQIIMTGLQVGVGKLVSERWYVGATGRWALVLDTGAGGMGSQLQVGPEARYVFHIGQGSIRSNGGPARPVPHVDWLSMRGGLEDTGPGTLGAFTEAAWGSDFRIGSIDFGTVMGLGLGLDEAGAYGDGSVVHPFVDMSLRFGLNL